MDTDSQPGTGFTGFSGEFATGSDYLLEGQDLYRYTGTGSNWSWSYLGSISSATVGGIAELELPRSMIGSTGVINFYWRGDNGAVNGSGVDFYPDAAPDASAVDADRRFRYVM